MRAGPKLSVDELATKVLTLESQVLEYKSILLQSEVFTQTYSPMRFELSDRQKSIEALWRQWSQGPSPASQSPSLPAPVPSLASLAPIPPQPNPVAPPPRRAGRPATWERNYAAQLRSSAENDKRAAIRIQEIKQAWNVTEDQARIALWAMTNLTLNEEEFLEKLRDLCAEWSVPEEVAYVVIRDEVQAAGCVSGQWT